MKHVRRDLPTRGVYHCWHLFLWHGPLSSPPIPIFSILSYGTIANRDIEPRMPELRQPDPTNDLPGPIILAIGDRPRVCSRLWSVSGQSDL